MKTLKTEQQEELKQLLEQLVDVVSDPELKNVINYWAVELKPKRIRKKALDITA